MKNRTKLAVIVFQSGNTEGATENPADSKCWEGD
jgi:hypothetical protein